MTDNSGCADNPPWIRPVRIDICPKCMELKERIAELEAHRVPNPGVVGTLQNKNLLLEYKDAQIARLQARVKKLEAIIGRIQSNRGDETEVDALCDAGLGKGAHGEGS